MRALCNDCLLIVRLRMPHTFTNEFSTRFRYITFWTKNYNWASSYCVHPFPLIALVVKEYFDNSIPWNYCEHCPQYSLSPSLFNFSLLSSMHSNYHFAWSVHYICASTVWIDLYKIYMLKSICNFIFFTTLNYVVLWSLTILRVFTETFKKWIRL